MPEVEVFQAGQDLPVEAGLEGFLDALASSAPVPGGGSVAALQAAMAAALLEMVAALTLGRKRFAAVEDRVGQVQREAAALRHRAHQLAQEDAEAYRLVADAMHLSRETESDRAARARAIQQALCDAVAPPLETMRVATHIAELSALLVDIGNPSAISDVGTAAASARAAYEAAELNVEINLAAITDVARAHHLRRALEAISSPRETIDRVLARTRARIGGSD